MIEISNVSKTYNWGKVRALDNVSLEIKTGEIFGLIGPNGAGKTTLMGCMLAALNPSSGTVLIDGKPADDLAVRQITAFLPERPNFDAWMTVSEFLRYHQYLSLQKSENIKADIESVLTEVGLDLIVAKRTIKQLSRGMLQRLGLAQVLIGKPRLIFLDEPTSGMDPIGMALVRTMLTNWKKQGITVILNSHHLDEVEKVCDRVAFIRSGKIEAFEEMSASAMQQFNLTVRWMDDGNAAGTNDSHQSANIEQIAKLHNIIVEEINGNSAQFKLPNRETGPVLIKELILSGLLVEEANLERQNLKELFTESKMRGQ